MKVTGRLAAAGALSFVLVACATASNDRGGRDELRSTGKVNNAGTATAGERPPSALDDPAHPDFPEPLIDLDDLLQGGPPPDGIPSIDDPLFQPVSDVDWLDDDEPVLSLEPAADSAGPYLAWRCSLGPS